MYVECHQLETKTTYICSLVLLLVQSADHFSPVFEPRLIHHLTMLFPSAVIALVTMLIHHKDPFFDKLRILLGK